MTKRARGWTVLAVAGLAVAIGLAAFAAARWGRRGAGSAAERPGGWLIPGAVALQIG